MSAFRTFLSKPVHVPLALIPHDTEPHAVAFGQPDQRTPPQARLRVLAFLCVLLIAAIYLAFLTHGHQITQDDFAAYIMHAANLVNGAPYTDLHYIPNPKALWLAPANGYPPVYPFLLTPAYKFWGLRLIPFKIITVLCFVGSLLILAKLVEPQLPGSMTIVLLFFVAANQVFWEAREYIYSEFPYLLFSLASLLVIDRGYGTLKREQTRLLKALLLAILLYATYGTRTIGVALLPAFIAADLAKFRRPSRFMLLSVSLALALIATQAIALTAPTGYVQAFEFSIRVALRNFFFYSKTLSYAWQNGFSKPVQIVFALFFTALAASGFLRRLWTRRSAMEFYLLCYLPILLFWPAEIGLRGLLPILPLYFAYGLAEFSHAIRTFSPQARAAAFAGLLVFVSATYAGNLFQRASLPHQPDVTDPAAQELFAFLRNHTAPSAVLIFPKPRTLALFTGRRVGSFDPGERPADSLDFMRSAHATILVDPVWSPPAWHDFLSSGVASTTELFHNSDYRVFEVQLAMP